MSEREQRLEAALRKLLGYFGGPVGVSLHELGEDAYVEMPARAVKLRVGDLIAAHAALED